MPAEDASSPKDLDIAGASDAHTAVSIARWFAQAARQLQEATGWHDTLQQMVELAGKVTEADLTIIIGVPHAGAPPELLAATDYATATELVALQRTAATAPAWQAIQDRTTIHIDDLAADQRWGTYATSIVSALAFRSVLAFCLLIDGQPIAALAMYRRAPQAFTPDRVELAAAFAEHATVAFNQIMQQQQIGNLRVALDHARDIGAAIGIIMEHLHLSQTAAFSALRRASQERNTKLYDVALAILETGQMPF